MKPSIYSLLDLIDPGVQVKFEFKIPFEFYNFERNEIELVVWKNI